MVTHKKLEATFPDNSAGASKSTDDLVIIMKLLLFMTLLPKKLVLGWKIMQ